MQDIRPLIEYYNESPRKSKRRFLILTQLFHHLVEERNFNDNMSQICSAIGVERKTVYRYYNSKEDIIAEVNYYIYKKGNIELSERINEVLANDELDLVDKFVLILNLQIEVLSKLRDNLGFSEFAKRIVTNLDPNSETYRRYIYLMNVEEFSHYKEILEQLGNAGLLRDGINADDYAMTIEQIILSFVAQTLEYEGDFNRFDTKNVPKVVQLILMATIKDYQA